MSNLSKSMSKPVKKAKDFKKTIKRLASYLKPRRIGLSIVIIFTIIGTIFNVIGPKILGNATTILYNGFKAKLDGKANAAIDFDSIKQILILLVILYLISAIFNFFMRYLLANVAQKTVYDIREDVNLKLDKIPIRYYDTNAYGDILSRVTNDIDNISKSLQETVSQFVSSAITIIGVLIMMFIINPIITLISLAILPISAIAVRKIAKKSQQYFKKQQKTLGQLNGHVEEMYSGEKIIKIFGREKKVLDEFNEYNETLNKISFKAQFISGIIMPLVTFINNIGYVILCIVGGIFVVRNSMTVGNVQAILQYSKQFGQPIAQMSNMINIFQSAVASAERVFEVLDEQEEIADIKTKELKEVKGKISFENVSFGYDDKELMKNINFTVKPGQMVAIVGPTGAGKTTLVNLLMRFYEVWSGSISIDDIDITDVERGKLRRLFGMVLQDTWLFSGTIKENIAYGIEDVKDEDIIKASKMAKSHHFIKTLPEGYDTLIGEDANNISAGQKQLITIARAILTNPKILILDEATSSVDTRTEINIQKAMEALMKGRTSFVIAHRLTTIRNADIILVMKDGDIIENGSHEELMQKSGFYSKLYASQYSA